MFPIEHIFTPECEVGGLGSIIIPRFYEIIWKLGHESRIYFHINAKTGNAYMTRFPQSDQTNIGRVVTAYGLRCRTTVPGRIIEHLHLKAHDVEGDYLYMQRRGEKVQLTNEPPELPKIHCILCCESQDLEWVYAEPHRYPAYQYVLLCPHCAKNLNTFQKNARQTFADIRDRGKKGLYYDREKGGMTYGYLD